jgi:diguanylate cyclase (GGDEF)-like protein/PAS domain S-box-containing protein
MTADPGVLEFTPGSVLDVAFGADSEVTDVPAEATVGIDETGRIIEWSDEATGLFGWSREEVLGESIATTLAPPFYREALAHLLDSFAAGRHQGLVRRRVEAAALLRDGRELPVELFVTQVQTPDGGPGLTALVRDISRRQRSEQLRAMQLAVSRLLMEATTLSDALPEVLETVAQTLGAQVATIWLPEPGTGTLRLHLSWHGRARAVEEFVERSATIAFPQADIVRRTWQGGLPFVVQEDTPHGNALLTAGERAGLRWLAAFELIHTRPVAGALVLMGDGSLLVDEDLLAAMGSVSSQMAQALARSAAEEALRESERQYRLLFQSTPNPILICDASTHRFVGVNEAAVAKYGYSVDEFLMLRLGDLHSSDSPEDLSRFLEHDGHPGRGATPVVHGPYRHRLKDGRIIDVEVTSRSQDFKGRSVTLALIHDITDRLALQRDLWNQAFHDSLTGVANRARFMDRLEQAVTRAAHHGAHCAVLLLDLDDFKVVNDSQGHYAGDQLLRSIAQRLTANLRATDTLARLGGDEFAVLLEDLVEPAEAELFAQRVISALSAPFLVEDKELPVCASIGIALSDAVTLEGDVLMRNADLAMYVAKAGGKNRYEIFVPTMRSVMLERVELEQDLRNALVRGELRVAYQPVVELASGRITGAEALVRWQHPTRGWMSPDAFIPLAEDTGLIRPLTDWVLGTACRQAKRWEEQGLPPIRMAVNISARELADRDLAQRIRRALSDSGLDPSWLELEITETAVADQPSEALAGLRELRALGVQIAIDDFGTGYSILSRLQLFPVDKLKIDKSFVDAIALAVDRAPLVAAMIAMGHGLGLRVVAEGVETSEQLSFLRKDGCDMVQGFLISRPVAAECFAELLQRSEGGASLAHWAEPEFRPLDVVSELVRVGPNLDEVIPALLAELERLTGLRGIHVTELLGDGLEQTVRWDRGDRSPEARRHPAGCAGLPITLPDGRVFGRLCGIGIEDEPCGAPQGVMHLFSTVIAAQIAADRSVS